MVLMEAPFSSLQTLGSIRARTILKVELSSKIKYENHMPMYLYLISAIFYHVA